MERLKKQTNIRGEVKETDKYTWRRESKRQRFVRRERNRQLFGETLKNRQIFVERLKKQTNIRGDVKETGKFSWRR